MPDDEPNSCTGGSHRDKEGTMIEQIMTQHNTYVDYVYKSTQFPINLVLI